jgi:nitrate/TMAO reductase-like tetraheme cytochrome c subunit
MRGDEEAMVAQRESTKMLTKRKVWGLAGLIGVVVGVAAAVAAERAHHVASSETFCGATCHSMAAYVSGDESYVMSAHQTSWSGVHAGCADCHIPPGLVASTWAHVKGGVKDIIAESTNDFSDPAVWEERRERLAHKVRHWFVETDSATCRRCHDEEEAIDPGFRRGRDAHRLALRDGITCIACHVNLVHAPVSPNETLKKMARGYESRR